MNTAIGVTRAILRSPKALVGVASAIAAKIALLGAVVLSEAVFDDLCLVAALLALAYIIYLQPDWALGPLERGEREVVWRIPTRQHRAALTIDDVPLFLRPTAFEEILDVLQENQVKATLFIMSGFMLDEKDGGMEASSRDRCLNLLKRAVAEGHELANHLQFDRPAVAMTAEEFDAAFLHCDRFLCDMAGGEARWRGRPRRWYRPGSALWNAHQLEMAGKKGYTTVIGNCYPHDVASVSRFLNPTYLGWRARPGSIIIVHDRWHTPATLAKALPAIAARGIQLGTLSELQAAADSGQAAPAGKKSE